MEDCPDQAVTTRHQRDQLPLKVQFVFMLLDCAQRIHILNSFCLTISWLFLLFLKSASPLFHFFDYVLDIRILWLIFIEVVWIFFKRGLLLIFLRFCFSLIFLCSYFGAFVLCSSFLLLLRSWLLLRWLDCLNVIDYRGHVLFVGAVWLIDLRFKSVVGWLQRNHFHHDFVAVDIRALKHVVESGCSGKCLQVKRLQRRHHLKGIEEKCCSLQRQWGAVQT